MRPRRIWLAAQWAFSLVVAFFHYLVKNPQATTRAFKFIVSNLYVLPRRLKHKSRIDERKLKMEQKLAECALLFGKMRACEETIDAKWLEETRSLVDTRWVLFYILLRVVKPALVVETGVAEGESTSYILQALADNGSGLLHSIDLPNQFYMTDDGKLHGEFNPSQESPGCLVPSELRNRWKLTLGKSFDTLPALLKSLGQIDLFLHDSEHTYETMTFEFMCAWPYIRPGGFLIADDVTWNKAFLDFAEQQHLKPIIVKGQGFLAKPK